MCDEGWGALGNVFWMVRVGSKAADRRYAPSSKADSSSSKADDHSSSKEDAEGGPWKHVLDSSSSNEDPVSGRPLEACPRQFEFERRPIGRRPFQNATKNPLDEGKVELIFSFLLVRGEAGDAKASTVQMRDSGSAAELPIGFAEPWRPETSGSSATTACQTLVAIRLTLKDR